MIRRRDIPAHLSHLGLRQLFDRSAHDRFPDMLSAEPVGRLRRVRASYEPAPLVSFEPFHGDVCFTVTEGEEIELHGMLLTEPSRSPGKLSLRYFRGLVALPARASLRLAVKCNGAQLSGQIVHPGEIDVGFGLVDLTCYGVAVRHETVDESYVEAPCCGGSGPELLVRTLGSYGRLRLESDVEDALWERPAVYWRR